MGDKILTKVLKLHMKQIHDEASGSSTMSNWPGGEWERRERKEEEHIPEKGRLSNLGKLFNAEHIVVGQKVMLQNSIK